MLTEIKTIIAQFASGSASATIAGGQGSEFEMWLLLQLANKIKGAPYNAELRDHNNIKIISGGSFALRGGPGKIGHGSACHVYFNWNGVPHEIHANVNFRGRSTETHEIDISIIPASVADHLRKIGGGYPTGQPRIAIECKFKQSTGSKDEARQVVARQFDMHFLDFHPLPTPGAKHLIWPESNTALGHGSSGISYMQSFNRCFSAICRLAGVTAPTGTYLAFNAVRPRHNLKPGTPQTIAFLQEFETFLASQNP